jgi:hypothetical protein
MSFSELKVFFEKFHLRELSRKELVNSIYLWQQSGSSLK